jgi:hypothetical protein
MKTYKGIRSGLNNAEGSKLQRKMEIAYIKNAGRKNSNANNEIPRVSSSGI